jgi:endonuclease/exonuclease/phosphatase family metal-dependent hydrolase
MTRNLYLGADETPVVEAILSGDPNAVPPAVEAFWQKVLATDYSARVKRLAKEIVAAEPELVGLQEAEIWRSQYPADGMATEATQVEYDFTAQLVAELETHGLHYDAVAVSPGLDAEFPRLRADGELEDLRVTDQDVILARRGVRVSNVRAEQFANLLPIGGGLVSARQWACVDAEVGGGTVRFVTTHLEDLHPVFRALQAEELVQPGGPADTSLPVVLLGDFNLYEGIDLDHETQSALVGAGFEDTWLVLHPKDAGLTWGRTELIDDRDAPLVERLDRVFVTTGLDAVGAKLVGESRGDFHRGLWPSDHAGIVVDLRLR